MGPKVEQGVAQRYMATVFGQNYGDAGAVDALSRAYGLPPTISGHNSYFLWGPPEGADVVIIIGGGDEDNRAACVDLRRAGTAGKAAGNGDSRDLQPPRPSSTLPYSA